MRLRSTAPPTLRPTDTPSRGSSSPLPRAGTRRRRGGGSRASAPRGRRDRTRRCGRACCACRAARGRALRAAASLRREPLAALVAAALEQRAAGARAHAGAEPVGAGALALLRLVGALHERRRRVAGQAPAAKHSGRAGARRGTPCCPRTPVAQHVRHTTRGLSRPRPGRRRADAARSPSRHPADAFPAICGVPSSASVGARPRAAGRRYIAPPRARSTGLRRAAAGTTPSQITPTAARRAAVRPCPNTSQPLQTTTWPHLARRPPRTPRRGPGPHLPHLARAARARRRAAAPASSCAPPTTSAPGSRSATCRCSPAPRAGSLGSDAELEIVDDDWARRPTTSTPTPPRRWPARPATRASSTRSTPSSSS